MHSRKAIDEGHCRYFAHRNRQKQTFGDDFGQRGHVFDIEDINEHGRQRTCFVKKNTLLCFVFFLLLVFT